MALMSSFLWLTETREGEPGRQQQQMCVNPTTEQPNKPVWHQYRRADVQFTSMHAFPLTPSQSLKLGPWRQH